jgi:hypothetical protein
MGIFVKVFRGYFLISEGSKCLDLVSWMQYTEHELSSIFERMALHLSVEFRLLTFQFKMLQFLVGLLSIEKYLFIRHYPCDHRSLGKHTNYHRVVYSNQPQTEPSLEIA